MNLGNGTYLAPEEMAYPNGGQTRPCRAQYPDGKVRRAWAGIPDTWFSIPAHGRIGGRYVSGYLTVADPEELDQPGTLTFHVREKDGER